MKNSSKILIALGLGTLAGGTIGYYLNSDKGRKQRKKAAKLVKKKSDEATAKMNEYALHAKSVIDDLAEQAKDVFAKATEAAEDKMEESQNYLKKGMEKAKAKTKAVEDAIESNGVTIK